MYKKLLLIFINVIILVSLCFLLNWVIYKYFYNSIEYNLQNSNEISYSLKRYNMDYDKIKEIYSIRKPVGLKYNNESIMIFGCSYAYGFLLEEKQTLAYKLSELLKRPVYNYASPGQSPQFAILRIRSHELDNVIKNSKYAIYVVIGEHVWRVHVNSGGFKPEYVWPRMIVKNVINKDAKGKRKKEQTLVHYWAKFPDIEGSYIVKYVKKIWFAKILTPMNNKFVQNYMFDFIKLHFLTIQKELKEINPDIKMIIIVYNDEKETELFSHSQRWNEFEKEGIIVVDLNKEIPYVSEYRIPNNGHPSELAWNEITKLMVKKLKVID